MPWKERPSRAPQVRVRLLMRRIGTDASIRAGPHEATHPKGLVAQIPARPTSVKAWFA